MSTQTVPFEQTAVAATAFPLDLTGQQKMIARLLEISSTPGRWRPDYLMPQREMLDKILEGAALSEDEQNKIDFALSEWAPNFLGAMRWWRDLAWTALEERINLQFDKGDVGRRLEELEVLEVDAFTAYAKANNGHFLELNSVFVGYSSERQTVELAKRYRLYTRYVEALLFEVWPDLNRELVFNGQPEWAHKAA
jgi:hypothetical protein